jgi:hypothetical protein
MSAGALHPFQQREPLVNLRFTSGFTNQKAHKLGAVEYAAMAGKDDELALSNHCEWREEGVRELPLTTQHHAPSSGTM